MIWILILAILIFFYFIFFKKKGLHILSVKIYSVDVKNLNVSFTYQHPETMSIEYLRLFLNYYSKIYLLSNESTKNDLNSFLLKIASSESTAKAISYYSQYINLSGPSHGKSIAAKLYYKDISTRFISTSIPVSIDQEFFLLSTIGLYLSIIPKLDEYQANDLLPRTLGKMSEFYLNGKGKTLQEAQLLPNISFMEA